MKEIVSLVLAVCIMAILYMGLYNFVLKPVWPIIRQGIIDILKESR